jgi:hypothetical protein
LAEAPPQTRQAAACERELASFRERVKQRHESEDLSLFNFVSRE